MCEASLEGLGGRIAILDVLLAVRETVRHEASASQSLLQQDIQLRFRICLAAASSSLLFVCIEILGGMDVFSIESPPMAGRKWAVKKLYQPPPSPSSGFLDVDQ